MGDNMGDNMRNTDYFVFPSQTKVWCPQVRLEHDMIYSLRYNVSLEDNACQDTKSYKVFTVINAHTDMSLKIFLSVGHELVDEMDSSQIDFQLLSNYKGDQRVQLNFASRRAALFPIVKTLTSFLATVESEETFVILRWDLQRLGAEFRSLHPHTRQQLIPHVQKKATAAVAKESNELDYVTQSTATKNTSEDIITLDDDDDENESYAQESYQNQSYSQESYENQSYPLQSYENQSYLQGSYENQSYAQGSYENQSYPQESFGIKSIKTETNTDIITLDDDDDEEDKKEDNVIKSELSQPDKTPLSGGRYMSQRLTLENGQSTYVSQSLNPSQIANKVNYKKPPTQSTQLPSKSSSHLSKMPSSQQSYKPSKQLPIPTQKQLPIPTAKPASAVGSTDAIEPRSIKLEQRSIMPSPEYDEIDESQFDFNDIDDSFEDQDPLGDPLQPDMMRGKVSQFKISKVETSHEHKFSQNASQLKPSPPKTPQPKLSLNKPPALTSGKYECFVTEPPCEHKYHEFMNSFRDHLINDHFCKIISVDLDKLRHPSREALECPVDNCGYIGVTKKYLIKHYAGTHKMVHRKLLQYARKTGRDNTPAFKLLAKNAFFDMKYRKSKKPGVKCRYCPGVYHAKHVDVHEAFHHFRDDYEFEIRTGQMDFGLPRNKCPAVNCKFNTSIKGQSGLKNVLIHYVRTHKSVAEMEKSSELVNWNWGGMENKVSQLKRKMEQESWLICPFLHAGTLSPCRMEFGISCKTDMVPVHHHIISHFPNLAENRAGKLIDSAHEAGMDGICPLPYCEIGLDPGRLASHVLEEHTLEIAALMLQAIKGHSNNELLDQILSFAEQDVYNFIYSQGLNNTDDVFVEADQAEDIKTVPRTITLPGGANLTIKSEVATKDDELEACDKYIEMYDDEADEIEIDDFDLEQDEQDDMEIKTIEINSSKTRYMSLKDAHDQDDDDFPEKLEIKVHTNPIFMKKDKKRKGNSGTDDDTLSESDSIEIIASRDKTIEELNFIERLQGDDSDELLCNSIQLECGQCGDVFDTAELMMKHTCLSRKDKDTIEMSSKISSRQNSITKTSESSDETRNILLITPVAEHTLTNSSEILVPSTTPSYSITSRKLQTPSGLIVSKATLTPPTSSLPTSIKTTTFLPPKLEVNEIKRENLEVDDENYTRKRKADDEIIEQKEYHYFCLDCESESPGSRVPLTLDLAGHILEKKHCNFQPIKEAFPNMQSILSVDNISYSRIWNRKVIKDWQRLVFNADSTEVEEYKYNTPRKCLKCSETFNDSADMFLHIRDKHIKSKRK